MIGLWDPLAIVLSLAAFAGGAWFDSYLREKGKHYATTEDMEKILSELSRTTRVAEDVKAEISRGLWLRQQQWNYRREIYERLFRSIAESQRQFELLETRRGFIKAGDDEAAARTLERVKKLSDSGIELRTAVLLAGAFLPLEARQAINELLRKISEAGEHFGDAEKFYVSLTSAMKGATEALTVAVRQDLLEERPE